MEPSGYFWLHALCPSGSTIKCIQDLWSHQGISGSMHCNPYGSTIKCNQDLWHDCCMSKVVTDACEPICIARIWNCKHRVACRFSRFLLFGVMCWGNFSAAVAVVAIAAAAAAAIAAAAVVLPVTSFVNTLGLTSTYKHFAIAFMAYLPCCDARSIVFSDKGYANYRRLGV